MTSPFLIPFSVAAENIPGLASGRLVRYGAILKDAETGRIVAHLQETGLLGKMMEQGAGLLGNVANPVGGIGSIVTAVQNEQIKSRLDQLESLMGGLETLQLATLVTSVAGIGVTMASTAIILNRIGNLDDSLKRVEDKLDALPAKWRELRVREALVDLQTHVERLDESIYRPDAEQVFGAVEEKLSYSFSHIADAIRIVSGEVSIDAEHLRILLAALSVCADAQFRALVYLDMKEAAQSRAKSQNEKLRKLTWEMPPDILEIRLGSNREAARDIAGFASELRLRLAARPHMLETMIAGNVHGREYIETSGQEVDELLLVMPSP